MASRRRSSKSSAPAREVLRDAFAQAAPGRRVEVGRTRWLGEGLTRVAYGAAVTVSPDPDGRSGAWVARLPHPQGLGDPDAEARHEAAVRPWLQGRPLPFRVPRFLALVETRSGTAVVEACAHGLAVARKHDPRGEPPRLVPAPNRPWARPPWEWIGRVAAQVHAVLLDGAPAALGPHRSRRAHAQAILDALPDEARTAAPEAVRALAERLPPEAPGSLLHGDLLGQNLVIELDLSPAPAPDPAVTVLDWSHATMGDPAYDLAIVTRGARRPFGVGGGLDRLLEAYRASGGAALAPVEVRWHELALALRWLAEARRDGNPCVVAEQARLVERLMGWLRA